MSMHQSGELGKVLEEKGVLVQGDQGAEDAAIEKS